MVEGKWIFYILSIIVLGVVSFLLSIYLRTWKRASKQNQNIEFTFNKDAFSILLKDIAFGAKIIKGDIIAGVMHLMIFWGFIILFIGTTILAIHEHLIKFIEGKFYIVFSFAMETGGLLLFLGLLFAFFRRYVQRIERLQNHTEDLLVLLTLLLVVCSGFFLEALRIAQGPHDWERWSYVGWFLKDLTSKEFALAFYPYTWWIHASLSLIFLTLIPLTKLFHILAGPVSIYLQNLPRERVTEQTEIAEELESEEKAMVSEETEEIRRPYLSISRLLFLDACMRCGRCVEACPSSGVGEDYAPRDFVQALRSWVWTSFSTYKDLRVFFSRSQDQLQRIWHCTTCRACLEVCPVYGPTFELILAERALAIEEGTRVPDLLNQTLERLFKYENPWVPSKKEKLGWIEEGMDVRLITKGFSPELCYFVGCTTSVEPRARAIAKSFSKILNTAQVDYGVFGEKEPCCGDIAKRVGELGLFEEKKLSCIELFESHQISKIVTSSPHCFFNFRNEYPEGLFEVYHYSQIIHKLIKQGKLSFKNKLQLKVTYHDPCYLGRHSRIFDEPREIISSIPGIALLEMKHNKENSLCCGGGGGRMWQGNELNGRERMSDKRAKEAIDIGAEVLITACPLCLIMLEDAIKSLGADKIVKVMDLNELVIMALD